MAATQVHVSVISSRFDLSEEPREREMAKMRIQGDPEMTCLCLHELGICQSSSKTRRELTPRELSRNPAEFGNGILRNGSLKIRGESKDRGKLRQGKAH